MKLEEAIHQSKPFATQHEKAIVNLIYTYGWLNNEMKAHFKKYDITGKQYNILRILKGTTQPISTSILRQRLLEKSSDVSRIVDRMTAKGLVMKKSCDTDKRLVDLLLTEQGLSTLEQVTKENHKLSEIMSGLSKKEMSLLNELLDKLRQDK